MWFLLCLRNSWSDGPISTFAVELEVPSRGSSWSQGGTAPVKEKSIYLLFLKLKQQLNWAHKYQRHWLSGQALKETENYILKKFFYKGFVCQVANQYYYKHKI